MSIISVTANPAFRKDQLEEWIRTQEATYGEIARIGNDGTNTAGSFHRFDPAHPRPTIEADLETIDEDAAEMDGELCRGIVFIGNALTHVAVVRPAA